MPSAQSRSSAKKILRLFQYTKTKNVGDQISSLLIKQLFGYGTMLCQPDDHGHLLATGSILHFANRNSRIWGSGMIDPSYPVGALVASRIHAVRGQLTHRHLREQGIALPDVPLGDPGFLVGQLRLPCPAKDSRKVGIAAHYVDRAHPWLKAALADAEVVDLDVRSEPEDFLERMLACDAVVSSSLHGLIFAEALGIRNIWIRLSNRVIGNGFKFRDWFSLARYPQTEPASPEAEWRSLAKRAALHDVCIDTDGLIASFPADEPDIVDNLGSAHAPQAPTGPMMA